MEHKQSPLPWSILAAVDCLILDANGKYVADTRNATHDKKQDAQTAAFIVRACNEHGWLVTALQRAVAWCEELGDTRHQWYHDAQKALAARPAATSAAALNRDAARYRWLASGWTTEELDAAEASGEQPKDTPQRAVIDHLAAWYLDKEQTDALIDAAMSADTPAANGAAGQEGGAA